MDYIEDLVLYRCVFLSFLLNISFPYGNSEFGSINEDELWNVIEKKIAIDYASDFSSQDPERFIKYFAPNSKINVYQYGKDISSEHSHRKSLRFYNGNVFSSLIRFRIPINLMAKTLFRRLKKQNYKESNIDLIGLAIENNFIGAYIRYDRVNKDNIVYHSARGYYKLKKIFGVWYIIEMNTYRDSEAVNTIVGYDRMMKPVFNVDKKLLD